MAAASLSLPPVNSSCSRHLCHLRAEAVACLNWVYSLEDHPASNRAKETILMRNRAFQQSGEKLWLIWTLVTEVRQSGDPTGEGHPRPCTTAFSPPCKVPPCTSLTSDRCSWHDAKSLLDLDTPWNWQSRYREWCADKGPTRSHVSVFSPVNPPFHFRLACLAALELQFDERPFTSHSGPGDLAAFILVMHATPVRGI
jgi:hypothetical protein